MVNTLIFCHGFASEPQVFDLLKKELQDFRFLDWNLGYQGQMHVPYIESSIAIGHSLGFMKLLKSGHKFKGIVSLAGFTDFLCNSKKRQKVLTDLIQRFGHSPSDSLQAFYELSKMPTLQIESLHLKHLYNDLKSLIEVSSKKIDMPCLSLAALDDPIVTKDVTKRNFLDIETHFFPRRSASFFQKFPKETAQMIRAFIKEIIQ